MTEFLSKRDKARLRGAEELGPSPVPTREISSGEFAPGRQTGEQKRVEARLAQLGDEHARRRGMSRRDFFRTTAGMAAAFVAMNEVYGPLFRVSRAEAADDELAAEQAARYRDQFIFDGHTHFLRDDSRLDTFVDLRKAVAHSGVADAMRPEAQSMEKLKFDNYVREIWYDSDTKMSILSGAPSDIPQDWFLTNEQMAEAPRRINEMAGSRRLLHHNMFTPGQPGWLDDLREAVKLSPVSWKGYTVGDNTHKEESSYPWRMDSEETYRGYEIMREAGIRTVCVHKGLFPPSTAERYPHLAPYATVEDVPQAAKDWPDFNFVIYHAGYRWVGGPPEEAMQQFDETGRLAWASELAEIPEKHGVDNVYADIGSTFADAVIANPRLAAAIIGILNRGLGVDKVLWGTDAVWWGSPQWQIEAFRRLQMPEDLQEQHGFQPLGEADGAVKNAIFGLNSARLYRIDVDQQIKAFANDQFAQERQAYFDAGGRPTRLAYGWVTE